MVDYKGRLNQKFLSGFFGSDEKNFILRIKDRQLGLIYGQIPVWSEVTVILHLVLHLNAHLYIKQCLSVRLF